MAQARLWRWGLIPLALVWLIAIMIEVSDHTDASGRDDTNVDPSKRRAQAVVDYLVTAGLDATHLTSIGYGKTRPLAEGRAKNRRIEFLAKEV